MYVCRNLRWRAVSRIIVMLGNIPVLMARGTKQYHCLVLKYLNFEKEKC
jgi:hypothetical protein